MPTSYVFKTFWVVYKRLFQKSRWLQIAFFILFWSLCQAVVSYTHLPIPGGVVGLFAVLALLYLGIIRIRSLARGAEWFLSEMLLFFIPAVPAILNHQEFFGWVGIKILAVIMLGTIIVIVGTAFIVELSFRTIEQKKVK